MSRSHDIENHNRYVFQVRNILNLEYGNFEGDGQYDIPMLLPVNINNLQDMRLQGFNYCLSAKNTENLGVHFFLHDYQFERVWRYPERYTQLLKKFEFVLSPDFSPYSDMPKATQIFNVYRNRWCGRYWQEQGIKVIPTVTWSDENTWDFCFDGIPKHSTIAISTMGDGKKGWKFLLSAWNMMLERLEPETVLLYGKDLRYKLPNSDINIIYKELTN